MYRCGSQVRVSVGDSGLRCWVHVTHVERYLTPYSVAYTDGKTHEEYMYVYMTTQTKIHFVFEQTGH